MSNFDSFSYFQTSLSLGVEQGLQKLPKFDINDLRLLFHCYILIPRKCPHKNPLKTQCPPGFINLPTVLFLLRLHLHLTNPIFLAQGSLVLPSCMPLLFFVLFLFSFFFMLVLFVVWHPTHDPP